MKLVLAIALLTFVVAVHCEPRRSDRSDFSELENFGKGAFRNVRNQRRHGYRRRSHAVSYRRRYNRPQSRSGIRYQALPVSASRSSYGSNSVYRRREGGVGRSRLAVKKLWKTKGGEATYWKNQKIGRVRKYQTIGKLMARVDKGARVNRYNENRYRSNSRNGYVRYAARRVQ